MTQWKCGRSPGGIEDEMVWESGGNSAGRTCACPSPHFAAPTQHGTSYGS